MKSLPDARTPPCGPLLNDEHGEAGEEERVEDGLSGKSTLKTRLLVCKSAAWTCCVECSAGHCAAYRITLILLALRVDFPS